MNKVLLIIVLALVISPCIIFLIGNMVVEKQLSKDLIDLKSSVISTSQMTYDEVQLIDLPEPVQRYFRYALKNGQPYISSVSLKHNGQFKTGLDKEWIDIDGEQYFSVEQPGFLWKGKTALFSVRDAYIAGRGRLVVYLFSVFKIQDGHGEKFDQGELLRWLGESVWFPTNLLPDSQLNWTAINDNTAKLSFHYKGQNIFYIVSFNQKGEITQLKTRRYMGEEGLETWIGRISNYQNIDGMMIPMNIEALWVLPDGEHSYADFKVQEVTHK